MTNTHTTNERDPCVTSTGSFENKTINRFDFPTGGRPSKVLATVKASFALHGHAVHDGSNHAFIVVRKDWGRSRYCQDLSALIAFGRQLGVL